MFLNCLYLHYVLVFTVCMVVGIILLYIMYGMVYWQHDMLLVCIYSRSYSRSVDRPKSRVNDMTRATKYHRKRAYFGTSTAVPYVVHGTVRTRMIRTRYIIRTLVSHDTGNVSRPHTGMHVPVLQNEDSSCSTGECNTSIQNNIRIFELLLPWILLVLVVLYC